MKELVCQQCKKTFSEEDAPFLSDTQTQGCASDVYETDGKQFVISNYGSCHDTSRFFVKPGYELVSGLICDHCIDQSIEKGVLTLDADFNYFEPIQKLQQQQQESKIGNSLFPPNNYNSFDHEQQILSCWQICDDLKYLTEGVLEKNMTPDQVSNVLIGLEQLYQLKFEKLFSTFEKSLKKR